MTPTKRESVLRVLSAGRQIETERSADSSTGELWLSPAELERVSGWQCKPEGLCKGEVCVPLAPAARSWIQGDRVCASQLWQELGRPLVHDAAELTWMLGEAAEDRARQLASLEAPDFTLPDIEGRLHSLSDFRGKKVLLVTWASW